MCLEKVIASPDSGVTDLCQIVTVLWTVVSVARGRWGLATETGEMEVGKGEVL